MRDKVAIIIIFILVMAIIMISRTNVGETNYEYYANGEFGKSDNCYQDKHQDCYCVVNNEKIKVDIFYVAE